MTRAWKKEVQTRITKSMMVTGRPIRAPPKSRTSVTHYRTDPHLEQTGGRSVLTQLRSQYVPQLLEYYCVSVTTNSQPSKVRTLNMLTESKGSSPIPLAAYSYEVEFKATY